MNTTTQQQPKNRIGSARAKPLVCYGAFLAAASAAEGNRALGMIFSNGRDRIKDAQLIASKRWRCSLNRVLLFHFDELGIRSQRALIDAEIKTLESLKPAEAR